MIRQPTFLALMSFALAGQTRAQEPLFTPAPTSPIEVGEGSGTILLQDINRDGRVDLLSRHLLTRRIRVLRGDGKGGFASFGPDLEFPYEPGDMKLGFVNGDRIPDLVVTPGRDDLVDVLLGDGQGGFHPAAGSPFTLSRVKDTYNKRTLHLLDLNQDGHLDIATANGRLRNTVRTLLGDGRGGFIPGPIIQLDSRGDGFVLAFGDVNGDRRPDVITASKADENSGRLVVQLGDGHGNFRAVAGSALRMAGPPSAIQLTDMDGNGLTDIVVGHSSGTVSVLLNRGQGILEPVPSSPIEVGSPLFALGLLDVNGDKRPDLIIPTVNHVTVLLAAETGFLAAPGSPYAAGPGAYYIGAGDVNGDGRVDLMASSFEGTSLTLLLGR
jgi:hypothetical protein